jgi:hypothetical protein
MSRIATLLSVLIFASQLFAETPKETPDRFCPRPVAKVHEMLKTNFASVPGIGDKNTQIPKEVGEAVTITLTTFIAYLDTCESSLNFYQEAKKDTKANRSPEDQKTIDDGISQLPILIKGICDGLAKTLPELEKQLRDSMK